jgi:hypothetical protein
MAQSELRYRAPDVADLVAEADRQARQRVLATLVERRTAELLAAVEAADAGSPASISLCVHAIMWAAVTEPLNVEQLSGVAGVRTIRGQRVAAVVSDVDSSLLGCIEELTTAARGSSAVLEQRHDDVVFAAARLSTVLPLPFGFIVASDADVQAMLRDHEDALAARLESLSGCWEWTVRLTCDEGAFRRRVAELQRPLVEAGARDGTLYLTSRSADRRVRESAQRLQREAAENVAHICGEFVEASVGISGGRTLHNAAVLVSDRLLDPMHTALQSLATELAPLGFAIDVRGPLPPYHFVNDVITRIP